MLTASSGYKGKWAKAKVIDIEYVLYMEPFQP